jgi:hypothetical protein
MRGRVQRQTAMLYDWISTPTLSAQYCPNAGSKLVQVKGFYEVVVGTTV